MEKVNGIGGVFFREHDPSGLAPWYAKHLGITPTPADNQQLSWQQESGPTVFAPFPQNTTYFGNANRMWMVNFRVANLDRMVAQLEAAGVAVILDPKQYPDGRFARLNDPEGNPVELWEPSGRDGQLTMKIRPFKIDDESRVIALWQACDLLRPWNDPHKDIARKLSVRPDLFLVGTVEGRVIASVMAGYDGHRGWMNYLGRRRNIAAVVSRL